MLSFNSLLIFSANPKKLAEFYTKVFAVKPQNWGDDDWYGFQLGEGSIGIGPHDKVKGKNKNPERIMFNLTTNDVKSEFVRIRELGVKVVAEPYQPMDNMWIAPFEDIDGNYFQLESPWEMKIKEEKPERMVN